MGRYCKEFLKIENESDEQVFYTDTENQFFSLKEENKPWSKIVDINLRRLKSLGFVRYQEYTNSKYWVAAKNRYKASGRPQECLLCGDKRYQLHHRHYDNLGQEKLNDLAPLCVECHTRLHWSHEYYNIPLLEFVVAASMMCTIGAAEIYHRWSNLCKIDKSSRKPPKLPPLSPTKKQKKRKRMKEERKLYGSR